MWALRRPQGPARGTVRVLHALTRFEHIPETLTIELTPAGYVALGDAAAYAQQEAERVLQEKLPTSEAKAQALEAVVEATELKRTVVQAVLKAWLSTKTIQRVGKGKKGDPYRYWRPTEMRSAALKTEVSSRKHFATRNGHQLTPPTGAESVLPRSPPLTAEPIASGSAVDDEEHDEWRG